MFVAVGAPRLLDPKAAFAALQGTCRSARRWSTRTLIDSWLAIKGDGTVVLKTGKVELGSGTLTTAHQLVADELDVPLNKVQSIVGRHRRMTPDQGATAGSQSTPTQFGETGGLRQAAAEARLALLDMASTRARRAGLAAVGHGRRRRAAAAARPRTPR